MQNKPSEMQETFEHTHKQWLEEKQLVLKGCIAGPMTGCPHSSGWHHIYGIQVALTGLVSYKKESKDEGGIKMERIGVRGRHE